MTDLQEIKIPIAQPLYKNLPSTVSQPYGAIAYNTVHRKGVDGMMVQKRPGLSSFSTAIVSASRVEGMEYWGAATKLFMVVVAGGAILGVSGLGTAVLLAPYGAFNMPNLPAYFAWHDTHMAICSGGHLVYTDGTTVTQWDSSEVTASGITHIAFLDEWLLMVDGATNNFYATDFLSGQAPSAYADVAFAAMYSGDYIAAMTVLGRRIILFGAESIEGWYNDGVSPFIRDNSFLFDIGILSPYAFCKDDSGASVYFIDNTYNLRVIGGNGIQILETGFEKEWSTARSSLYLSFFRVNDMTFVKISDRATKSYVYDITNGNCQLWSYYSGTSNILFKGECSVNVNGRCLVGSATSADFYTMSWDNLNDIGNPINFYKETARSSYGHDNWKLVNTLGIHAQVGDTANIGNLYVNFRDDIYTSWSNDVTVPAKSQYETDNFTEIYNLGMYKSRQYRLWTTDDIPVCVKDMYEKVFISG